MERTHHSKIVKEDIEADEAFKMGQHQDRIAYGRDLEEAKATMKAGLEEEERIHQQNLSAEVAMKRGKKADEEAHQKGLAEEPKEYDKAA